MGSSGYIGLLESFYNSYNGNYPPENVLSRSPPKGVKIPLLGPTGVATQPAPQVNLRIESTKQAPN